MYSIENTCCLCLNISINKYKLHSKDTKDCLTCFEKLTETLSKLSTIIDTDSDYVICESCYDFIGKIYEFNKICIENVTKLKSYQKDNVSVSTKDESTSNVDEDVTSNFEDDDDVKMEMVETVLKTDDDTLVSDGNPFANEQGLVVKPTTELKRKTCQIRYCKSNKTSKICCKCSKYVCGKCTLQFSCVCRNCHSTSAKRQIKLKRTFNDRIDLTKRKMCQIKLCKDNKSSRICCNCGKYVCGTCTFDCPIICKKCGNK